MKVPSHQNNQSQLMIAASNDAANPASKQPVRGVSFQQNQVPLHHMRGENGKLSINGNNIVFNQQQ